MTANVSSIAIVLPLKINANTYENDLFRLTNILLPSLVKNFNADQIKEMLVITPDAECGQIKSAVEPFQSDIHCRVIPETAILNMLPGWRKHISYADFCKLLKDNSPAWWSRLITRIIQPKRNWHTLHGWYRQQILKLAAAHMITTDYYLTCDADLCLKRTAGLDILFPKGKAILSLEKIDKHPEWWDASAKLLDLPLELTGSDTGMSVTPEILSVQVVKDLLAHIGLTGRKRGYATIFSYMTGCPGWSEYTLYWLYLLRFHNPGDYYSVTDCGSRLLDISNSVWEPADIKSGGSLNDKIAAAFNDATSLFIAVQSNTVSGKEYAQAIQAFLN